MLLKSGGRITLPEDVLDRYQLVTDTPVRMIETRNGILLVPLTKEPMVDALRDEIEAWQELGAESLDLFPYEDPDTSDCR